MGVLTSDKTSSNKIDVATRLYLNASFEIKTVYKSFEAYTEMKHVIFSVKIKISYYEKFKQIANRKQDNKNIIISEREMFSKRILF